MDVRNVGIVAHVDHGKTTLVDALFRQAGLFRENEAVPDRVMDSNDLERERGITILSKVASCTYQGTKMNIVDTPGHADFGGEVERVLSMVDGVVLVVDACEGPMPQSRFVLRKAFQHKLKVVVCINKIDREGAAPLYVYDKTVDLFIDLGCTEDDLDFPVVYASGSGGFARTTPDGTEADMRALFDAIVSTIPPPSVDPEGPVQFQVSALDYSTYLGRMFGGKIRRGRVRVGDRLIHVGETLETPFQVTKVWVFEGLQTREVEEVEAGEIAMVSGLEDAIVGDTVCDPAYVEPIPRIAFEPPTMTMAFYANSSPLAGKDGGKALTIHKIRDRLEREANVSVSLEIDRRSPADVVKLAARGEMQLSVLIETMRREGFEMAIGRPEVILGRDEAGGVTEPLEELTLETPDDTMGSVMEELARRKGEIQDMTSLGNGRTRILAIIPTRGLIGFRTNFLTMTRGEGLMSSTLQGYGSHRGEINGRSQGALIAKDPGPVTRYAYEDIQERGTLFYPVGTETYGGMIVGACARDEDMVVNITKTKAATNMRSSNSEATTVLDQHRDMSLEQALAWLREDELLEATPKSLRFRKRILDHSERKVSERKAAV